MSGLVNRYLVKALADMAVFLEFTSEELLDEDTAIGAMEQLAAELQLMADEDRRNLAQELKKISMEYDEASKAQFVHDLPESLGLE